MMRRSAPYWKDILFLLGIALFFFGCIASSHRSGRTLDPGQGSFSGSYLRAVDLEEPDSEPIQLLAFDMRVGITKGVDIGGMHTWDISEDNDNMFATFWGDAKIQVTNKDNLIGSPIVSVGIMKGYIYHEYAELHVTTLPISIGVRVNENLTPYLLYRHEFISDDFLPDDLGDSRSTIVLGTEVSLAPPVPNAWTPKVGLSVGWFNSIDGCGGDPGLLFNFGLSLDTPTK